MDLSKRLESYMARRYHLWASEVYLSAYTQDGGTIDIRPDFLAFSLSHGNYASKAAWVERGTFTAFEVKSCKDDFESGHGLNFIGDKNYIVTTREFGEQLRYGGTLYDKMPSDCDGVLVPSGNGLRMLFDRDPHGLRGGYRKWLGKAEPLSDLYNVNMANRTVRFGGGGSIRFVALGADMRGRRPESVLLDDMGETV